MDFYGQKCTEEWLPVWRSSFRAGEKKDFLNKFTLEIPLTEYITWKVKQINNYFHKIFHLICGGVLNLPLILINKTFCINKKVTSQFLESWLLIPRRYLLVQNQKQKHYSKLWNLFKVFIINFEQISGVVPMFSLLTLNK